MTDAVFVLLVARYETLTVSLQQRVDHALEIRLEIIREEKRLRAENRWYRPMADPEWDRLEAKRRAIYSQRPDPLTGSDVMGQPRRYGEAD